MNDIFNAGISLGYLIIPLLLLPLLDNAPKSVKLNLLLAIAFIFSCGVGHGLEAISGHWATWHLVTMIASWAAVIALFKSQNQLRYLSKTFQLLDITWNESITGKILLERMEDDLKILKINLIGSKLFQDSLKPGDLLSQNSSIFGQPLSTHDNVSLLTLYLNAFESGKPQQMEFHSEEPFMGDYLNIFVPVSNHLLYVTYLDISPIKSDALTGLYNRRYLDDNQMNWQAFLYIDLDRFKLINDQRGHKLGDKILVAVAKILREEAKQHRGVAIREGGDEFVLLLPFIDAYPVALSILEKIWAIEIEGANISASIGLATIDLQGFEDNELLDRLQQAAETAAREAKKNKQLTPQNRICIWTNDLAKQRLRQLTIEGYLHQRSTEKEFWLAYQPICNLKTGEIVGAEALIRWNSAILMNVAPNEFIPIAEATGLIYQITKWVFRQALQQLSEWHEINSHFWVSINISPIELEDKNFISFVSEEINHAQIPNYLVALEVTERGIYQNLDVYLSTLRQLKQLSISLKVDDFGTGQSGLLQLLQFHFDEIKLDRSFMPDSPNDKERVAVCEAIANIAQGMNFNLTAEGIESETQRNLLLNLGYLYGQGYYFAKPMTPENLTKLLEDKNTRLGSHT